jgi:hypothetical protein
MISECGHQNIRPLPILYPSYQSVDKIKKERDVGKRAAALTLTKILGNSLTTVGCSYIIRPLRIYYLLHIEMRNCKRV